MHALWCERPNFNPPGVQNSSFQSSQSPLQIQSSQEPVIDLDATQLSDSDSGSPVLPSSSQKMKPQAQQNQRVPAKRTKGDPIEQLKSSVKEISEIEIVKIKEEYAYKRFKLEMQDKDLERQVEEKKLHNYALNRSLEEKRLRFQAEMQLYEFRFQQWVEKNIAEEPEIPVFQ